MKRSGTNSGDRIKNRHT